MDREMERWKAWRIRREQGNKRYKKGKIGEDGKCFGEKCPVNQKCTRHMKLLTLNSDQTLYFIFKFLSHSIS